MALRDERRFPVIIVGGGQAGLSLSYLLNRRKIDHLILERHRIAHSWREARWDSFCLVTPNQHCRLPGFPYNGVDPDGFMSREEIIRYIEDYARSFDPPVRQGIEVSRIAIAGQGGFDLATSEGPYHAGQVVVATGGYHTGAVPRMAERLPSDVVQLHTSTYRRPEALPEGDVLVVGSGQSGCQIAEDLHLAGRTVHLAVGTAPRSPRRYRGKDVVDWLSEMGYYDIPIDVHPKRDTVRTKTNHYVTGRDGGREIDLRQFALEGMQLHGRLTDISSRQLHFADDLEANLDHADEVAQSIKASIDAYIVRSQQEAPAAQSYEPVWRPSKASRSVDLTRDRIRSVIWATGYRTDFSWIDVPIFDGSGYPGHARGVTSCRGLYFLGLPWLYTWGSGRFSGVGKDAAFLAERIAAWLGPAVSRGSDSLNQVALGS